MSQFNNIQIAGIETEIWRAGKGRPILFLHSGEGVEPALPVLQSLSARYDVIAPSHPGFGGSELPGHFRTVDDLAYFYLDLIKELHLNDVLLVGCSFGGWIAAEIAIKNTADLSGLVLVDALGVKFLDETTREIFDLFSIPQYQQTQISYADERKVDYSDWSEEALVRLARNHRSLAIFGWSPTLHDPKLRPWLHRIDLPTLVLWGGADRIVPPEYGRRLAESIPGASFKLIEGAGHHPPVEVPAEFEAAVTGFFAATVSVAAE